MFCFPGGRLGFIQICSYFFPRYFALLLSLSPFLLSATVPFRPLLPSFLPLSPTSRNTASLAPALPVANLRCRILFPGYDGSDAPLPTPIYSIHQLIGYTLQNLAPNYVDIAKFG